MSEHLPSLYSLLFRWYGTSRPYRRSLGSGCILTLWEGLWFPKGPQQKTVDCELSSAYESLIPLFMDYVPSRHEEKLALIILYDQIPRSVYRATPQAYFYDSIARRWAREVISSNPISSLSTHYLLTIVICLLHSEEISDHSIVSRIVGVTFPSRPDADLSLLASLRSIARNHRERVEIFGRIPERNATLGRTSSDKEKAYVRAMHA